jgi:LL-diaminopimelate aminotransferase
MSQFYQAERLALLPPYLFAEIDRVKAEVKAQGKDIISLGIGDPDLPTPDFIIAALCEAAKTPVNHQYPSYVGLFSYRQAVADWYKERFGVVLDPETEVVNLIGSKEGIAHFPLAFVDPGDVVLSPSPGYPVYASSTGFAGGRVVSLPLLEENDFLPDLDAVSPDDWHKAKIIFVNYPNNPTSAMADRSFFEKLVKKCKEYSVILVHDAAYTEIYFDPENKPMSILEIDGAKDVAIEFHSLSKTYNMTGWRTGMAVGAAELVKGLGKIKENVDSGCFQAVQEAGIAALKEGEPYAQSFRDVYRERRDAVCAALTKAGIEYREPQASFYVWAKTPAGFSSSDFVTRVIRETGVVLTPGTGFGAPGEGYFRISLTVPTPRLEEAVSRITAL